MPLCFCLISAAWYRMLSPASADHADKKWVCNKCWKWREESKMVLLALRINALWRCIILFYFDHVCHMKLGSKMDMLQLGRMDTVQIRRSFHQRFSFLFFSFVMGKQLEKLVDQPDWTFFHAASKLACRSIILFLFFALIVILLFVQTMHSLCLWPLVSTTELLQLFFFFFWLPF